MSQRKLFSSVSGKLRLLISLNVAGFLAIAGIIVVSGVTMTSITTRIVDTQMYRVSENANTTRDLAMLSADIELVDQMFFGHEEVLQNKGPSLIETAKSLNGRLLGTELQEPMETLLARLEVYLDSSASVNRALSDRKSLSDRIWAEFDSLEARLSRLLIDLTLRGEETDPIDQILALVTGYRESLLLVDLRHAKARDAYVEHRALSEGQEVLTLIDDLHRRLQTITASEPAIAAYGIEAAGLLLRLRVVTEQLYGEMDTLWRQSDALHQAELVILDTAADLSQSAASAAVEARVGMNEIFTTTGVIVLVLSVLVIGLVALLIVVIVRRHLQEPLANAAESIARLGEGDFGTRIQLGREDEWARLEEAYNSMVDEISLAYQALRDRENLYRHLIENQSDLLVSLDHDGVVRFANNNTRSLLATGSDGLVGSTFLPQEEGQALFDALSRPPYELSEERQHSSHNGERWVAWSHRAKLTSDGQIAEIISVGRDTTDRKNSEETLMRALRQSELANRAKSEFLANISHELRTPLNAIIGFSDIIKSQSLGSIDNEKYLDYAGDIYVSGQHLLVLINDILDVSAIEAGKVELKESEVSSVEIAQAALRFVRPRAQKGEVALVEEFPQNTPVIRVDERRIKQVLINLLSNAIKFTEPGGAVTIIVGVPGESEFSFSIVDNGIGMTAAELTKAMSEFGQVDAGFGRKYEGTGLGLPLAKGLVGLHGGRLEIESEKGQGTTVRVVLPPNRIS